MFRCLSKKTDVKSWDYITMKFATLYPVLQGKGSQSFFSFAKGERYFMVWLLEIRTLKTHYSCGR